MHHSWPIPNSILFKLGCRAGKLDQSYPFNSLTKTDLVTDFKVEDIPDRIVSVRQAISTISIAGGQGVKKCSCKSVLNVVVKIMVSAIQNVTVESLTQIVLDQALVL